MTAPSAAVLEIGIEADERVRRFAAIEEDLESGARRQAAQPAILRGDPGRSRW